jgi:hypothetical protein
MKSSNYVATFSKIVATSPSIVKTKDQDNQETSGVG